MWAMRVMAWSLTVQSASHFKPGRTRYSAQPCSPVPSSHAQRPRSAGCLVPPQHAMSCDDDIIDSENCGLPVTVCAGGDCCNCG